MVKTIEPTPEAQPADLAELVGLRVWYVAVNAQGFEPVVTTGTITAAELSKRGELKLFVEADVERQDGWLLISKWRDEADIIEVIEVIEPTMEKAVA